MNDMDFEVD